MLLLYGSMYGLIGCDGLDTLVLYRRRPRGGTPRVLRKTTPPPYIRNNTKPWYIISLYKNNKPFYLVLTGFPHILDSFPHSFIQVWEVWRFGDIRVWRFGRVSERVVWTAGHYEALDTGVLLPIYKPQNLISIYLFHISKILLWKNLCITYPD